jgi:hypothetical protein
MRDGGSVIYTCDRRRFLGETEDLVLALPKAGGEPSQILHLPSVDSLIVQKQLWALSMLSESVLTVVDREDFHVLHTFDPDGSYFWGLTSNSSWVFPFNEDFMMRFRWSGSANGSSTLWDGDASTKLWQAVATEEALYMTTNSDKLSPYPGYKVLRLDLNSFATSPLTTNKGFLTGIAVVPGRVIVADSENGKVLSVAQTGGDVMELADVPTPWSLATDASFVYVASRPQECKDSGAVYRIPLKGGPAQLLSENQACPSAVLVDDDSVYWMNTGPAPVGDPQKIDGAAILRIKKPRPL